VKAMLVQLPLGELTEIMDDLLNGQSCERDVRALLKAFADERDIPL
jgi:phosphotransferase system enzyme I (PtsP)